MRLHRLTMTAFGPFAGVETVDFDELCDAGLFLLTGPTGAGKTSILDAISFALYGTVPGVRGVKSLKSHHAADDTPPEVVLDFSVRDRRFVVRRRPEWSRPKRRGTGRTTENASATLLETTSGQDHLLSSRAQEVGHFIGELIGMRSTQFVQVAMLPQGDFQKFLRATTQDRHEVLQHLFRTDRFSRIEDWVHDHSRTLKERSATGHTEVVRILDTLADRAGVEQPEGVQDRALEWTDELLESSTAALVSARDQHQAATAEAVGARSHHEQVVRLRTLVDRRDQARATLAGLAREGTTADEAARRVDADDRASRCAPLVDLLDNALADAHRKAESWAAARGRLRALDLRGLDLPDPLTPESLTDLEQRVRAAATRLRVLLPREKELARTREALAAGEAQLDASVTAHDTAAARRAEIPAALEAAGERVAGLSSVARRIEALSLELRQAEQRLEAARSAARLAESLTRLREAEREARDAAADARDVVQDLTARRLSGIAAELAGRLSEGSPCQVCGSTEHPRPAEATDDPVTEAAQARAAEAYEELSTAHTVARGKVLQAEERLAAQRESAGHRGVMEGEAEVAAVSERLAAARAAEVELADAERAAGELAHEQQELVATVHELGTQVATLTESVTSHRRTVQVLGTELAEATGASAGSPDGSLSAEVSRLDSLAGSVVAGREALCEQEAVAARVQEIEEHLRAAAREQGFDDVAALRDARLEPRERARLDALLDTRAQAEARARAVLDDDEVRAVGDDAAPDVTAADEALARAEAGAAAASRTMHQREEVVTALTRHRRRLEDALESWAPMHQEYLRADSMAKLVRGMGADNQLQMRLSAYVLARRLDQVVAAANERLAHMRDQRYLLQRTGRAARKRTQAGLGLEVVDQWTGEVRDPATLSGGETFVVSLSLALGLADVVTQEAGGVEIETLFVDEGFGTLDADTLDDVMDRLDELRAGGRAVGVVSHVSEMRNRIPTQLHVEKRRNGSSVAVRTAVG